VRVAVRNRVFSINPNWEANIVAKTRFLIAAGGQKKPGFFDKLKLEVKIMAKTRFLILDIIWPQGFP